MPQNTFGPSLAFGTAPQISSRHDDYIPLHSLVTFILPTTDPEQLYEFRIAVSDLLHSAITYDPLFTAHPEKDGITTFFVTRNTKVVSPEVLSERLSTVADRHQWSGIVWSFGVSRVAEAHPGPVTGDPA